MAKSRAKPFFNTLKKGIAATALYASMAAHSYGAPGGLPFKPEHREQKAYASSTNSIPTNLPSPLTQTNTYFYLEPEKEFKFYKDKYTELAQDSVIDSKDAFTLENVLNNTLSEINTKISDNFGKSLPPTWGIYIDHVNTMRETHFQLQRYLSEHEAWANSPYVKKKFVHFGLPGILKQFLSYYRKNWPAPQANFTRNESIKSLYDGQFPEVVLENIFRNTAKITRPEEELPAKSKLPFSVGLGLSALALFGSYYISWLSRIELNNHKERKSQFLFVANGAAGLFIDGLHPFIYPARIIAPLLYQFVNLSRWASSSPINSTVNQPNSLQSSVPQSDSPADNTVQNTTLLHPQQTQPSHSTLENLTEDQLYQQFLTAIQENDEFALDLIYNRALSTHPGLRYRLPPRLQMPPREDKN